MADLPGAAGQAAHDAASATGSSAGATAAPGRLVLLALGRAIPALIAGLITAFTGAHTPLFGLVLFGGWAILDALCAFALLAKPGLLDVRSRQLLLGRTAVVLVAGLLAVVLSATGALTLVLVVGITAVIAGLLDLLAGLGARGTSPIARDLLVAAAVTLLLGVVALVIPPGLSQPFPGAEGHPGVITGAIVVTGLFGGWGVITGVLWAIAAVGLRPPRDASPTAPTASGGAA